jgi:steroid Delta-isomerase
MKKEHEQYIYYLQNLTENNLNDLPKYMANNIKFKDPLHNVSGISAVNNIFETMFKNIKDINFTVNYAISEGDICFLEWRFQGRLRGKKCDFNGTTLLKFGKDGLLKEHTDYWDSGANFFAYFPILGGVISYILKTLRAT